MARPKDPNLELAWRQRLQRHSTSGLSISAFCACEAYFPHIFRPIFPNFPSLGERSGVSGIGDP
jgi:hypothetical protein